MPPGKLYDESYCELNVVLAFTIQNMYMGLRKLLHFLQMTN